MRYMLPPGRRTPLRPWLREAVRFYWFARVCVLRGHRPNGMRAIWRCDRCRYWFATKPGAA